MTTACWGLLKQPDKHEQATCRFYAELNDFLPSGWRGRSIPRNLEVSGAVKDFIEAIGVPHTEVDLILVDGEPSGFQRLIRGGERISV